MVQLGRWHGRSREICRARVGFWEKGTGEGKVNRNDAEREMGEYNN